MKKLYAPSTVNEIRNRHDFKNTKSLGQNFLTDKGIIDKIVDGAGVCEDDLVLEIGPGLGVITWEAAQKAGKVIAVEIDKNLIPILKETLADCDNVEVLHQDILKTDINEVINRELATGKYKNVKVIGNLPYYITTPIIMKILEDGVEAESLTFMMQKEVADRIQSAPGKKTYGAVSVAVQYYCEAEILSKVPRDVFIPQPNVDSAVLKLTVRKEKAVEVEDRDIFLSCIKAGFGQRRKTLLNSLMGVDGMTKDSVKAALEGAGIDPSRRAETLDLEEFATLANQVYEQLQGK